MAAGVDTWWSGKNANWLGVEEKMKKITVFFGESAFFCFWGGGLSAKEVMPLVPK